MRGLLLASLLALTFAAPNASAHGALTLNEFDTYMLSDFEAHEDSFVWEGFEIWDIYAGDGYNTAFGSHGVYFKGNFAGDGTLRPTGGEVWELTFHFTVGAESMTRTIAHDGTDVTTDFDQLEHQIADGNVFQIHAWASVADWRGHAISDLVVVSSVDGQPRDTAPGGFHDPATGTEIPFSAPSTVVFPPMGEGRVIEALPLTGAAKFLDVQVTPVGDSAFDFTVTNPLAAQGQHFMFHAEEKAGWSLDGAPSAQSIDGGMAASFRLHVANDVEEGVVEPLRIDLMTDIGGMQSRYAFLDADGRVRLVDAPSLATTSVVEAPVVESPAMPLVWLALALVGLAVRRR